MLPALYSLHCQSLSTNHNPATDAITPNPNATATHANVDVHITSPPNSPPCHALQGASHTTGGVLCGQAQGNVFSHADCSDAMMDLGPCKGKVHVYMLPKDPSAHKPDMTVTSDVTPTLKPVLKALAWNYSPVHSEYIIDSEYNRNF